MVLDHFWCGQGSAQVNIRNGHLALMGIILLRIKGFISIIQHIGS